MENFLVITTETISTIMYVLVFLLLIGNILFLVLFIASASRCSELEKELSTRTREKISSTEHDQNADQPIGSRMEDKEYQKYVIKESKEGFAIHEKETGEVLSVSKTKEEAKEIIKGLSRKN